MGISLHCIPLLASVSLLTWAIVKIIHCLWWKPMKLQRCLKQQGIMGPPRHILHGNLKDLSKFINKAQSKPMALSHSILPRVVPLHYDVLQKYGKISVIWYGTVPRINIMNPEIIREILSNKFEHFTKPRGNPLSRLLLGGVATYDGEKWAVHRRIISPAFHLEKVKSMLPSFALCSKELIRKWSELVDVAPHRCEIDVWPDLQSLTADVISHTAFGSNFKEGQRIFQLQTEQAVLVDEAWSSLYIPGFRFLPTKKNLRRWQIEKETRETLTHIIKKREEAIRAGVSTADDLLSLLLKSNMETCEKDRECRRMSTEDVLQECKLFYFAGQETTSVLLTWTMVLLSMHPHWQTRAREEVLEIFGGREPSFEGLARLKIITMIFYEVMRLYPPAIGLTRSTSKEIKVGDILLPAGVQVHLATIMLHHDPDIWGNDVEEFKPERFAEGVSHATKSRVAFIPFGWGPRICLGQNFALLEAKLALAFILQHFWFEPSPTYCHAPYTLVTLHPQYGAPVIMHSVSS